MITIGDIMLLIITALLAGRYYVDGWPRRRPDPRARYTTIDAAVDATTFVVDGLQQDIDSLRTEIRTALQIPPESRVPDLIREVKVNRSLMLVAGIIHIALLLIVAWLVWELRRRGLIVYLTG